MLFPCRLDAPTPLERPYGSCGVRVGSGVAQAMRSVVLAWGRRETATLSLISGSEGLRWLTIVCLGDHGRGCLKCVSFELPSVGVRFFVETRDQGRRLTVTVTLVTTATVEVEV